MNIQGRPWLALGVGALMLAGLFSIIPLAGRTPVIAGLIGDPLFARRCLVVHVNLSLVVWLLAVLCAMRGHPSKVPVRLAWAGVLVLLASAFTPGAAPVMSNYVPAIDHPLFVVGLFLIAAGVTGGLLAPATPQEPTRWGMLAASAAWLLALVTLAAAVLATPTGTPALVYYESIFWGAGHLVQFAHVAGMLTAWILLATGVLGRSPMDGRTSALLFATLVLPLLNGPFLALLGPGGEASRLGFTRLMQLGIVPVVAVVGFIVVKAIVQQGRWSLRDPHVATLAASIALTLAGFVLGAMVRGANTVTPAHYHASIGGVTAAYMGLTLIALGRPSRVQPLLFASGQLVFALGFGLAGASGMLRKVYGAEQHIRNAQEWLGMGLMGLGGLAAIAGGLLFLYLATRSALCKNTLSRS